MRKTVPYSIRGLEHADRREGGNAMRWTTVSGKRELLPDNPHEVAKILRERRTKSPASKAKAKMAAAAKQRGF